MRSSTKRSSFAHGPEVAREGLSTSLLLHFSAPGDLSLPLPDCRARVQSSTSSILGQSVRVTRRREDRPLAVSISTLRSIAGTKDPRLRLVGMPRADFVECAGVAGGRAAQEAEKIAQASNYVNLNISRSVHGGGRKARCTSPAHAPPASPRRPQVYPNTRIRGGARYVRAGRESPGNRAIPEVQD